MVRRKQLCENEKQYYRLLQKTYTFDIFLVGGNTVTWSLVSKQVNVND